ncbi:MAG TPA: acetoacetate--CoA ligase [Caulobacterales bacterium]|nr:acetoacetate--CoA ligase [Caulobacterales bacterium]
MTPVKEGDLLWRGGAAFVESANVTAFMRWLERTRGLRFDDYASLYAWSVADIEAFWAAVWDYFAIISDTPYESVLSGRAMPGVRWFDGSRVNYAEHVLRHEAAKADAIVLYHSSELRPLARTRWAELGAQVRALATALRARGVGPGDRVVSYLPNIVETMVAMLATVAIGAVWSAAAPEFGVQTVVDRFAQIEPKLMFAADGYRFGGKDFNRRAEIAEIVAGLPSLETIVWLDYLGGGERPQLPGKTIVDWRTLLETPAPAREAFRFERVACDHPLWVLYSSGTTGLPKAIVHSHVGVLLEQLKSGGFHGDLKPSSIMFFYTTTGWMMWNALTRAPLAGGAAVLYDGSPAHGGFDMLWRLAEQTRATTFGASPTYVELMRKHGVTPRAHFDLSSLQAIALSGSPATPETFVWFYENVRPDLWITSQSGGTEFCSGLVVGAPTLPVYAGEIQARALGADVRVFSDAGEAVVDEVGELVVAQPMPSMPLRLWGDDDFAKYKEAFFDVYPGVWRHGDFMKLNRRGGCYIYGRSDATLNRFGVRIGSAEIYRTMESIDAVLDSLIVCIEEPGGGYFMPLFVKLRTPGRLSDALLGEINTQLRTQCSPRHVPDVIIEAPSIPYTLTGKRMEVPVRKLLMGWAPERAFNRGAMQDGAAMDWYLRFAAERRERVGAS